MVVTYPNSIIGLKEKTETNIYLFNIWARNCMFWERDV